MFLSHYKICTCFWINKWTFKTWYHKQMNKYTCFTCQAILSIKRTLKDPEIVYNWLQKLDLKKKSNMEHTLNIWENSREIELNWQKTLQILQKVVYQILHKTMNKYCIENKQYIMNNNQIQNNLKLFINYNISNLYCTDW